MAINKKLIHFLKLADFEKQRSAGNILDTSIVFIQDANKIYTHGTFYDGSTVDLSDIENSIQTITNNKVDKVSGKGLSTNDYTTTEKNKLAGIASGAEVNVQSDWGVTDTTSDAYIKNKPSLATVATSGSYNDLSNKPSIDSALSTTSTKAVQNKVVTAGINAKYTKPTNGIPKTDLDSDVLASLSKADTALQSYTEKYTGTYSKPSTGIPKSDLASAVLTSLGKADTALLSIPSEYITEKELAAKGYTTNTGTVTAVKINGTSKSPSNGVVDLGTVIVAHQDISGKLDSTTAASTYLTKTDAASTYLGKSAKAASATKADSATKATQDASGNVITSTYATKTEVSNILGQIDTLVSGDADTAIESFNEIIAFLEGVEDTETLDGIIAGINTEIAKKADKSSAITNITRSGTTFTATRADGTTFTFNQQDNNTTYTFAGGTNLFTVTPSGGTAQTVTVTPSISKNVTYTGTLVDEQVATFEGTTGTIKASGFTIGKSVPSNAVFTDTNTKVTSVGNHYTPAEDTSAAISAASGTATNITGSSGKLNVVTGLKRDAKGHIVGVTSANIYSTDNNTQYSSKAAVSGGSDVSLVTTGEKYTWNSKASTAVATTSANGLMSSTDKSKLDGIASGATAVSSSTVSGWGYTKNAGTVTSVATGVGLTGGSITSSGTVKAKLRSETALTVDSAAATTTSGRVYPVAVDKTGYLAVNVPWTDTNTLRSITDSVSTTSSEVSASATAVKSAYDKAVAAYNLANGKTSNTGTVTSVATGAGLTGGTITGSGTLKAALKSETKSTLEAAAMGSTASRQYAVGLDKNGILSINVPWTDTTYSLSSLGIGNVKNYDLSKAIKAITRSGTTFTYTCLDGTTGTFTQQDNNTTYGEATTSAAGLMSATDKSKLDGIATGATKVTTDTVSGWGFTKNAGTVTSVKVGSTTYNPSSGVVSLPAYPTSLPASDVSSWAKQTNKPSYTKSEVGLGNVDNTADANKSVKYATSAGSCTGNAATATKATQDASGNTITSTYATKTAVNSKQDKIATVNHGTSDTSFALTPNIFHVWGTVTTLTLTLATPSDSTVYNEYMFLFVSGTTATSLSLPSTVKWVSAPSIETGKIYQCSIVNNVGIIAAATNV